jgi:hypothetical protein
MKKSTLVVLEKGNDCAFDGPLTACCIGSFLPFV